MKLGKALLLCLFLSLSQLLIGQTGKITGQTISRDGEILYFTQEVGSRSILFRSELRSDGLYTNPQEVQIINNHLTTAQIRSPFLSYDGTMLYFSANIADQLRYDIYSSSFEGDQWQAPLRLDGISSTANEDNPSLTADNQTIYFTRREKSAENGSDQYCKDIYYAQKKADGKWSVPVLVSEPINSVCETTPLISADGNFLFFASDRAATKRKKAFALFTAEKTIDGLWSNVESIGALEETDLIYPMVNYSKQQLVALQSPLKSSDFTRVSYPLTAKKSASVNLVMGHVHLTNLNKVRCAIFDQSGYLVAQPKIDNTSGNYVFCTTLNEAFVELSAEGTNKHLLSWNAQIDTLPSVQLFKSILINIQVVDADLRQPISVKITPMVNSKIGVVRDSLGYYYARVPLGQQLKVNVEKEGFVSQQFQFSADSSLQFTQYIHRIALVPQTRMCNIEIKDASSEAIDAQIEILSAGQLGNIETDIVRKGQYKALLRKNLSYKIKISKPNHMLFITEVPVDMAGLKVDLDVKLIQLDRLDKYSLPNLSFTPNTANLSKQSGSLLSDYVQLINQHPDYKVRFYLLSNESANQRKVTLEAMLLEKGLTHPDCKVEYLDASLKNKDGIILQFTNSSK